MRRLNWLWVCSLMLASGLAGCIKREPRVEVQQPEAPVEAAAVAPEARPPTGNWGKVKGVDLLAGKGMRAFGITGAAERVKATFVKTVGEGFSEAIRAETLSKSENPWDVQLRALTTERVESGDVLLATVFLRTVKAPEGGNEGESEFVFELSRDPWAKSITQTVRASSEWKKLLVPFIARQAFDPGEAQITFRLGFSPQIIELGGVVVENFGKQLALADIPKASPSYPGMAADAPWRMAAAERIEEFRKADLRVIVRDASGNPVPDAKVTIRQQRLAFEFGTSAPASEILAEHEQKASFREVLRELFTVVVPENALRWPPLAGDWGARFTLHRASTAVAWLDEHGFGVRGTALVSPGWRDLPKSLRAFETQPDKLRGEVDRHIRELVTAFRGKVGAWDVVEKPTTSRELLDILGDRVLVEWLTAARASDPGAKLFVSDSVVLSSAPTDEAKRRRFEDILRMLVDAKAPIDGIGLSSRLGSALMGPADIVEQLDRFAIFGKRLYVTEFDVAVGDPDVESRYIRDFYTAAFSHPAVDGVVMWGFWDGAHWKNDAPLYGQDWTPKPAAAEFRRLVLETFRSNAEGATTRDGSYATRAFLGAYEVEVKAEGKSAKADTSLASSGAEVVLVLR